MDKLEKLEQKKARVLPQSWRGKRLARKIADIISEREQSKVSTKESHYSGIEVFDTPKVVTVAPIQQHRVIDVAPAPVLTEIDSFEHPKASFYTGMVMEDLGNPNMTDISEATKQALDNAPFSPSFRKTMDAFIAVQKHRSGKGPMHRGDIT